MLDSPFDLIAYVKKYFQQKSTRYKNSEKKVSSFVVGQVFSPFRKHKDVCSFRKLLSNISENVLGILDLPRRTYRHIHVSYGLLSKTHLFLKSSVRAWFPLRTSSAGGWSTQSLNKYETRTEIFTSLKPESVDHKI